jgi:hypothetical protein
MFIKQENLQNETLIIKITSILISLLKFYVLGKS